MTLCIKKLSVMTLIKITFNKMTLMSMTHSTVTLTLTFMIEWHHSNGKLSGIMLSVVMQTVFMISVVILNVVAPSKRICNLDS
jgi:hypothetical protein